MTVKEFLGQAYLLDKRIKSDTLEYYRLREMAQTISSPGFEEHYNATKNTDAPYVRTLEKMMDMEKQIMNEMNLLLELKRQIRDVIAQVDKPEHQTVLRFRYIHNESWPKIGEEVCADPSTVQRWHNKAIAKIKLPDNAISLKSVTLCDDRQ